MQPHDLPHRKKYVLLENTWGNKSIDMNKNFSIDSAIEIKFEGNLYDLHNRYDFKELKIDVTTHSAKLLFTINNDTTGYASEISFTFSQIDYFELSSNFTSRLTHELEEMGYKNPEDNNIDWLIKENKSTEKDHLLFRFINDEFLRIHAKSVHCSISGKKQ